MQVMAAARTTPPSARLQQTWLEAVWQGNPAIQRWLSTTSKVRPPQVRTAADADAHALLEFREQVGRLDKRCDPLSQAVAVSRVRERLRYNGGKLESGQSPCLLVAARLDHLRRTHV